MSYLEDTSESHMPLFGKVIFYYLTCYREISCYSYCDGDERERCNNRTAMLTGKLPKVLGSLRLALDRHTQPQSSGDKNPNEICALHVFYTSGPD